MLACAYPALDRPVILFQDVVEILHRSMLAILLQSLLGFEPHDGRWITGGSAVLMTRGAGWFFAESLGEKALGRCCVALAERRNHRRRWSRQPGINRPTCP